MDLLPAHVRIGHPLYLLWWHLKGRAMYRKAHGHDWHKATGFYPWWERPFRKDART